ncbi:MAG: hypothetical protein ACI32C_05070 [Candidatus Enteromonas sp.]
MENKKKALSNEGLAFIVLIVLALVGVVALFFRGLAPEAGYPFILPLLLLSASHPVLVIIASFFPFQNGLGLEDKERKSLLYLSCISFCILLVLALLCEFGSFGEEMKNFAPLFAFASGVPASLTHAGLLLYKVFKNKEGDSAKKTILTVVILLVTTADIIGLIFLGLGNFAFGYLLLANVFFAFLFPNLA